jgi:protein-S-isoprenylcysteine O-methyltransferase Ste14
MVDTMKNKFLEQAVYAYSPTPRFITVLLMALIFLVVLPFLLIKLGGIFDQWLGQSFVITEPVILIFGWPMISSSSLFAMCTKYYQFTVGRGTPLPWMATQQLIVQPPYTYYRNLMTLGAFVLYLGVSILYTSYGTMFLVLLLAAGLIAYIKRVEETGLKPVWSRIPGLQATHSGSFSPCLKPT